MKLLQWGHRRENGVKYWQMSHESLYCKSELSLGKNTYNSLVLQNVFFEKLSYSPLPFLPYYSHRKANATLILIRWGSSYLSQLFPVCHKSQNWCIWDYHKRNKNPQVHGLQSTLLYRDFLLIYLFHLYKGNNLLFICLRYPKSMNFLSFDLPERKKNSIIIIIVAILSLKL